MILKKNSYVLAIDDGPQPFNPYFKRTPYSNTNIPEHPPPANIPFNPSLFKVELVGVTCMGLQLLHVSTIPIQVDGVDATEKVLRLINSNPYRDQIRLIMIDSPTLAGFNPPNPFLIFEKTNIPLILLPSHVPEVAIVDIYQRVFPERIEQISFLSKLPDLQYVRVKINKNPKIEKDLAFHLIGIERDEVVPLLQYLSEFSGTPEPLRMAHLIASRLKIEEGKE